MFPPNARMKTATGHRGASAVEKANRRMHDPSVGRCGALLKYYFPGNFTSGGGYFMHTANGGADPPRTGPDRAVRLDKSPNKEYTIYPTTRRKHTMSCCTITGATRPKRAVLDTDTYNEIDDQFALAYALLAPEVLDLRAVVAAPFSNRRAATPGEGMRKSCDEIARILDLFGRSAENFARHGSESYLADRRTPVDSEGARRIVELACEAHASGGRLYVLAIAALTDVASALLIAPEIAEYVTIVWLGGHQIGYGKNDEFNLRQDVAAAQVVFDSAAPLVWIPCREVASKLTMTLAELAPSLAPAGKLGKFLYGRTEELMRERDIPEKIIWDIAAVACFTVPEALTMRRIPAPVLNDDRSWSSGAGRRELTVVADIDRAAVFADLFARLARFTDQR